MPLTRVVRSYGGAGRLLLAGGEAIAGRYHVDVRYHPVRRLEVGQGAFTPDRLPDWDSVADLRFAGEASLVLSDGRTARVRLGGIADAAVAIISMDAPEPP